MARTLNSSADISRRALQFMAGLTVISLAWQFVTAGQLFPTEGPEELHEIGAIVVHVLTGLVAVTAALHAWSTRGPWWPTVVAAVVFALSFVQAHYGGHDTLAIHVPGALVLTIGVVVLATWSFAGGARRSF